MLDVAAQHAMKNGIPLHFIRFNPDGYTTDGQRQKPKMAERHKELLLGIEEPVAAPLTGTADVTRSDEFPPDLRGPCKTRVA
jgi:hypothetical protein